MSRIYIDSLIIKDFGPYYDEHIFEFGNINEKRAILIGGKNGTGKTHLLRAIYLATVGQSGYGDLKKVESDSEKTTKFDLKESLNRQAKAEGKNSSTLTITLSQRDESGTIGRTLTLIRQIKYRLNSEPSFLSKAQLSGELGWIEGDEEKIQKLRDTFFPRHLARFFLFDAERNLTLKLSEKDVTEGISRVLGLYAYTELENDLRQLITNKIQKVYGSGSELERKLNDVQAEIIKSEKNIQTLNSEIEERKMELSNIQTELFETEERLQSAGTVDPEELNKAQNQREIVSQVRANLQARLESAWELPLPIALLGTYRNKLHDYLLSEESRRDWENRRSSVEPKIPQVKQDVFENIPSDFELNFEQRRFYEKQLENALQRLFNPPPEGMSEKIFVIPERNEVSVQVRMKLKTQTSAVKRLVDLCEELDDKTSELRDIEMKLKSFQKDEEDIRRGNELSEKRGSLIQQKETVEARLSDLCAEKMSIEARLKELKREEGILGGKVQKLKKGRDINSLANKYREAVLEIKQQAAIHLREKISDIVGELWLDITDKGMEYIGLEFDHNWNCFLKKQNGSKQPWESANHSEGQKKVRILAFTEALRRLARLVLPLIVDTPFDRLDKEVKESVLERLYLTGHQSIILSRNDEIAPYSELFERISPKLARVYTLSSVLDSESHSYYTHVSNDYFKRVL